MKTDKETTETAIYMTVDELARAYNDKKNESRKEDCKETFRYVSRILPNGDFYYCVGDTYDDGTFYHGEINPLNVAKSLGFKSIIFCGNNLYKIERN